MTESKDLTRTLTNALKELRLIKKKMRKNVELVRQYSSISSDYELFFPSKEEQKQKVQSLIQAQEDHVKRFLLLKRRVEFTNVMIQTEIDGQKFSMSDLIQIRVQSKKEERKSNLDLRKVDGVVSLLFRTYNAMSDDHGEEKIRLRGGAGKIIRFYDEQEKQEKINRLEEFVENVGDELDTFNTVTKLLVVPDLT